VENDPRSANRAFVIGIAGNGALAALKVVVGWLAGSSSLLADGWHSFADVVVNAGAWGAHRLGQRAPDEDHHYGHGKLEAFAGMTVGILLLGAGVSVGASAFFASIQLEGGWRVGLALGVAVLSIAVNAALALVASRGADATGSAGLAAIARDNGSDALSSVLVVVGILGGWSGLAWAEPLATVLIGCLIVVLGWRSTREGFDVLMDRADPAFRELVSATAAQVEDVRAVQRARIRPTGDYLVVEIQISVDGSASVDRAHEIAHAVEDAITLAYSQVGEVHVHVNPATSPEPSGSPEAASNEPIPG